MEKIKTQREETRQKTFRQKEKVLEEMKRAESQTER